MIFCGDDLLLVEKTSFFPQVIITERAEHALTVLQSDPLHHYDGVVSVGGDGMLAEVPKTLLTIIVMMVSRCSMV